MGNGIARVQADLSGIGQAQETLEILDAHLRQRLAAASLQLTLGHGDFTPGNVLVDARTGSLCAVVDWDTYHPTEICGVDRWHFVLQEALAVSAGNLVKARHAIRNIEKLDPDLLLLAAVRMHERAMEFGQEGVDARRGHADIIQMASEFLRK